MAALKEKPVRGHKFEIKEFSCAIVRLFVRVYRGRKHLGKGRTPKGPQRRCGKNVNMLKNPETVKVGAKSKGSLMSNKKIGRKKRRAAAAGRADERGNGPRLVQKEVQGTLSAHRARLLTVCRLAIRLVGRNGTWRAYFRYDARGLREEKKNRMRAKARGCGIPQRERNVLYRSAEISAWARAQDS